MKHILLTILILEVSVAVIAQNGNGDIQKGNEAYKKQEYAKASVLYQKALQQNPGNNIAAFNLGNALFREDKADEAMAQFESSAESVNGKTGKADALYNRGVVLTKQKKLDESIAAYKDVLRLNPIDTMARQNLQRALNEKKKQQNKLNKQQVAQMLNALQEQEKQLQQKMQKQKTPSPGQPDKDW